MIGHLELDNFNGTKRLADYKDIVVLMRSTRSFIAFKKIFNKFNIPSHIVLSQGFLQAPEIINLVNVLKAFNNRLDDIAFTSLLKGNYVISHFSENFLAQIKIDETISMFDNCINYLEKKLDNYEALETFINYYQDMRNYFNSHSIKESLMKFLEDSNYLPFLASLVNGPQRVANIELMIQKLDEMHDDSLNTITTKFDDMINNGVNLSPAMVSSNDDNVVSFMTIHKSKGLEFPIVFVSNMQNKFNQQDARERIISDKKLGIAIKPRVKCDLEPYQDVIVEYENKYRKVIATAQTSEAINEEMRIFYVALTRASQKLIMTGLIKEPQDLIKWQKYVINNSEDSMINPRCKVILYHNARKQNSYLDWLGISLMSHSNIINQGLKKELLDHDQTDDLVNEIKQNFQTILIHQNKHLIQENTKHSKFSIKILSHHDVEEQIIVSNKSDTILDLSSYHRYSNFEYPYPTNLEKSIAVTRKIEDGDRSFKDISYELDDSPVDAGTRGTIIHSVLEHLDIDVHLDLSDNLNKLKQANLYDNEAWQLIDKYQQHLENFITSPVYQLMVNADYLYREKEFSMLENGQIIHGIFDVVCIKDNQITIIDYKTDNLNKNTSKEILISLHKPQMDYYKKILARVFPQANIQAIVYYLYINKYVTI